MCRLFPHLMLRYTAGSLGMGHGRPGDLYPGPQIGINYFGLRFCPLASAFWAVLTKLALAVIPSNGQASTTMARSRFTAALCAAPSSAYGVFPGDFDGCSSPTGGASFFSSKLRDRMVNNDAGARVASALSFCACPVGQLGTRGHSRSPVVSFAAGVDHNSPTLCDRHG